MERVHRSISFDAPAAYTHLTEQLWRHELEDCMTLHQQQQQLAESRLRRHEFTTMDELLKENRDFVQSQRFYNVRSESLLLAGIHPGHPEPSGPSGSQ